MSLLSMFMGGSREADSGIERTVASSRPEYLVKDPGEYGFDVIYRRMPNDERNSLQVYIKGDTIKVVLEKKSIVYSLMKIAKELTRQKGARISSQKIVMKHPKTAAEHKSIDAEVDKQIMSAANLLSSVPDIYERLEDYLSKGV